MALLSAIIPAPPAAYTRTSFTATASQTTFNVTYTPEFVEVYLNGVLLNTADYTSTNGTSIVLVSGAALNDIVEIFAYNITSITTASTAITATNLAGGAASRIPFQTGAGTTAFIANGNTGEALISAGASTPVFGVLGVAGGGTGVATLTANNVIIGNGTSSPLFVAPGTSANVLTSNGSTWISSAGASAATPTALGTVYGKQTTSGGTPFLTAYGHGAAGSTTGVGVTAIGVDALYTNSTGARITAIGRQAGYANTGDNNLFIGVQAGFTNTTGTGNSFVGGMTSANWPPGYYNLTGSDNNAFGGGALTFNSAGSNNTAVGTDALYANTASNNTAVGYQAGKNNTTGTANVYMGYSAGRANLTGNYNVGIGREALDANTGSSNVGIGYYAVGSNTSGESNTGVGREAISSNQTGTDNTALGHEALQGLISGSANTAVGRQALKANTGSYNTAVGYHALKANTSNNNNTAIGNSSLNTATGASNTGCGDGSGYQLTTGSFNCFFGHYAYGSAATNSNEIVIGYNTVGKGGSTGFINPASGGVYQGNNSGSWSTTSDRRLKKNIVNNNIGLEKITAIQVRNFEYRLPEEITELPTHSAIKKDGVQLGVIAQELQAVLPDCVKTESTGVMSVDSDNLTWYMINAIKELKAELDAYKASHP